MKLKLLFSLVTIIVAASVLILSESPPWSSSILDANTPPSLPNTSPEQDRSTSGGSTLASEDPGADSSAQAQELGRSTYSREMTPVLPTVSGFELGSYGQEAARSLAAEIRDPAWAADMEGQILEAIESLEGLQVASIEVECRTTACGILLVHAAETDANSKEQIQITGRMRDQLSEMLGFGENKGVTSFRSSGDFSAIYLTRAEGREQYAEPATVPALPGVGGFEIPRGGDAAHMHPALYLASRPEDPAWSTPMEARIFDEISQRLAGDALTQVVVECRSHACGIVLAYPVGTEPIESQIGNELSDTLDIPIHETDWHETGDGPFLTVYLYGRRCRPSSGSSDAVEAMKTIPSAVPPGGAPISLCE